MKRSPLLAALLVLLAGRAAAQEPSRLDPALRLSRWSAGARVDSAAPAPTIPAAPGRAAFALGATARIGGEPYVRALIRLAPGGEAALRRLGVRIGVRAGDVVTARIPLAALPSLAAEPSVRFMEAAAWLAPDVVVPMDPAPHAAPAVPADPAAPTALAPEPPDAPANDSAVAGIGVEGLRRRDGDRFYGLTGRGVAIGIVDTGIDLAHEDFRDG
ncbi:MAG: hypothetical protein FWJ74_13915, partial [Gemmatimonadota bacterium]